MSKKPNPITKVYMMKVPVVSTRHITRKDHDQLAMLCARYRSDDYGYHPFKISELEEIVHRLSPEIRAILDMAIEAQCTHIRFDGEVGDVIPELPQFDW